MVFTVADTTHLHLAPAAYAVFASCVGAARTICVDVRGLNPFSAGTGGAIDSVLGGVFHVLFVPFFLKGCVKQSRYFCRVDWLSARAAFRGHVLRVGKGEIEKTADAGMAHVV